MAGVSIQRSSPFRVSTSWDSVFRGVREGVDSGGRPARLPEKIFEMALFFHFNVRLHLVLSLLLEHLLKQTAIRLRTAWCMPMLC